MSRKLDLTFANKGLSPSKIAVHNGTFHADDVFAGMLLRAIYPKASIVRTRDSDVLDSCDIVVDVGLEHDPAKLRFDHHQEGRAGQRENGIQYSGFGLVWLYWGLEVCGGNKELYDDIDRLLVMSIDASDNGQNLYPELAFPDVRGMSLDDIVKKAFNPNKIDDGEDGESYKGFVDAMNFAEIIFSGLLDKRGSFLEAKTNILESYAELSDKRFMIEEEHRPVLGFTEEMPELLYYIFPNTEKDSWLMKAAGKKGELFVNRKDLPKSWAGKNGKDLEEVSGVEDMTFCHNGLFICGAKTKEAITKALMIALEE